MGVTADASAWARGMLGASYGCSIAGGCVPSGAEIVVVRIDGDVRERIPPRSPPRIPLRSPSRSPLSFHPAAQPTDAPAESLAAAKVEEDAEPDDKDEILDDE